MLCMPVLFFGIISGCIDMAKFPIIKSIAYKPIEFTRD